MRKLLHIARRGLIPICLVLVLIALGWKYAPNYLVLPNLFDYGVSYALSADRTAYGALADMAERRIGERGAVAFIEAGLDSAKPEKIARTFVAVRELDKAHGDTDKNRALFFVVADFLARDAAVSLSGFELLRIREQALRYLFRQEARPWFDASCRSRLLTVFLDTLSEPEQRLAAKYLADKAWFVDALTEKGLERLLHEPDGCDSCDEDEIVAGTTE